MQLWKLQGCRSFSWLVVGLLALLVVGAAAGGREHKTTANPGVLDSIWEEIVPSPGTKTSYGMPLNLANLPVFINWFYQIDLNARDRTVFHDALIELAAPCCDDNTMFRCCCEEDGRSCNIVRSGKGLAAYLIREKGFNVAQVREAFLQWLTFARPDYYVAPALKERRIDPGRYGLTTKGSCYRTMCEVPISEGGCGGMGELIELEDLKG